MAKTSSCPPISTPSALPILFNHTHNSHLAFNNTNSHSCCKSSFNSSISISNVRVANLSRCRPCRPNALMTDISPLFTLSENTGYSQASYYTSLGLFLLSVPGLWSLIKRSTKSKIVQKTFVVSKGDDGKTPNQIAGEVLSFFTRNNFAVKDRGETITFEGMMVPSRGQAVFLTFCTCISLASVALVLTITFPDIGDKWYWITILSPLAGLYYWRRASRKEQIKVKMVVADDESSADVIVQGDDEQVDQLRKELSLMEKGMVYVKGILER
uniref:TSA: Wollemia nobilis Ref_Wollemi_Transcript_19699_1059 transcribed RNA sequence n=1 Tax=Wollemia nobilis TaxID=56998 RepID=A0A0C9QN25_9CONI